MISGYSKKAVVYCITVFTTLGCRGFFEQGNVNSNPLTGNSLKVCQITSGATLSVYDAPSVERRLDFGIGSGTNESKVLLYVYENTGGFYKVKVRGPSTFADGKFHYVSMTDSKLSCEGGDGFSWDAIKKREQAKPKIDSKLASKLKDQDPIYNGNGVYRCKGSAQNLNKDSSYFDFTVTGRFGTENGGYDFLDGKVLSANLEIDWKKTEAVKPKIDTPLRFYHSKLVKQWQTKLESGTVSLDFETTNGAARARLKLPGNIDKRSALPPYTVSSICQFNRFDGDESPVLDAKSSKVLFRYRTKFKTPFVCNGKKAPYTYKIYGARVLNSIQNDPAPLMEVKGWQDNVVFSKEMKQRNGIFNLKKVFAVKPSFPSIKFSLGKANEKGVRGEVEVQHVVSDGSETSDVRNLKMKCY